MHRRMKMKKAIKPVSSVESLFGQNVFGLKNMKKYLSEKTYKSLVATIREGRSLDPKIADEVAGAMKKWALSKGATHFTHWFQPLTGETAEKHDAFFEPTPDGNAIVSLAGLRNSNPPGSRRTPPIIEPWSGVPPRSRMGVMVITISSDNAP